MTLLRKLQEDGWLESEHGPPSLIIVLRSIGEEDVSSLQLKGAHVFSLEDILSIGSRTIDEYRPPEVKPTDLLTLCYTSGTTGQPKGVMLSNGNILHQIKVGKGVRGGGGGYRWFVDLFLMRCHVRLLYLDLQNINLGINPGPGDVVLSLLPCWHIFERSAELFALARGASLVYSSVVRFKSDLQTFKPMFLIVVPRLLENVHKSIKDKFAANPKVKRRLIAVLSAISVFYSKCVMRAQGLVVRRGRKIVKNPFARTLSILSTILLWPLAKLADLIVWKKVSKVYIST